MSSDEKCRNCGVLQSMKSKIRNMPPRECKRRRIDNQIAAVTTLSEQHTVQKLWTSYGEVSVLVIDIGDNKCMLQNTIDDLNGNKLSIKCVDAQKHKLNPDVNYNLTYLAALQPTIIDKRENADSGARVSNAKKRGAKNDAMRADIEKLNAVDIHFLTNQFIEFLHKTIGVNNVISQNILVSVHNVPKMDNAYFTGTNMMYGNGDRYFVALGKADVAGHELAHGAVQTFSGLEYRGHSGALNESFADVFGTTFEFWLYQKFNKNADKKDDIAGNSDWFIGEDVGAAIPFLRNMSNPIGAIPQQPDTYRGMYWHDPNNEANDYGGVHINSGVTNKCFYLASKKIGIFNAFELWFKTLKNLKPTSSFIDFRDELKKQCKNKIELQHIEMALKKVGLDNDATSDWHI